ncbi:MAG: ATP-binding protein [Oscillospiraceae bacterium]|nr:ATP-binding protein [Oscillospiraceae bacterium]
MDYIKRSAEAVIAKQEKMFKVILITGARQVGKSTLLQNFKKNTKYISLDDIFLKESAVTDPKLFIEANTPPIIIDEIQYAPNLLNYIKINVDNSDKTAMFYLTGSQQFHLMKNVSESLAGRIGILNLLGLSLREINNIDFNMPFISNSEYFKKREEKLIPISYENIWEIIHRGSFPALYKEDNEVDMYYSTYVNTYIERDVRSLTQVGDILGFVKFMTALASRIGQMLNLNSIATEAGISVPTANKWLSILVSSNIVYLLEPYYNNIMKRAIKTPKLYFLDTGLAAYLTKWKTKDVLESGTMAGNFFENFVVVEIIKSYYNTGELRPPLYYYRDKDKNEIDLIIEQNGKLHPIEIKKSANPNKDMISSFRLLEKVKGKTVGEGGIICMYDRLMKLNENNWVIPVDYL